jgi:hypothetical protein
MVLVRILGLLFLLDYGTCWAQQPAASPEVPAASEYEIDYEEEADADLEPTPTPAQAPGKKVKNKAATTGVNSAAVQGSRAKNRFAPLLRSETKSVYKKDGRRLDVDTD